MNSARSLAGNRASRWGGYAWALTATALCTALGALMAPRFEPVNIVMVYLLSVVVVALRFSRGPAITASVASVAAFDFFFVPPHFTFAVADVQYVVTFVIMLAVALVISTLVDLVREAETESLRSTLLTSISHDMRTPLAVISGASSSLLERGEGLSVEERRALAASIYRHSQDMAELAGNVLQMTRLEHGEVRLKRDWVLLPELFGSALARMKERLEGHEISVDLVPDLPLVRVDPNLIEQVLANLLENAAKHTPAGTRIWLRAELLESAMLVSVEDDGPGLPPAAAEALFATFERGEKESTTTGMGLGLSICRAILRLHKGKIWVERRTEGGTAFRFTLPLEAAPRIPAEAASPQ